MRPIELARKMREDAGRGRWSNPTNGLNQLEVETNAFDGFNAYEADRKELIGLIRDMRVLMDYGGDGFCDACPRVKECEGFDCLITQRADAVLSCELPDDPKEVKG